MERCGRKINSAEKAVSAIGFNFPKSISNKIVTVLHKLGEIKFDMQFRCSEIEYPEMPLDELDDIWKEI